MDRSLQEATRRHLSGEIDDADMLRIALRTGMRAEDAVRDFGIDVDALDGTEYSSNNSGGYFWLTDENWKALADGGWIVSWAKNGSSLGLDNDGRYMGQLATRAFAPLMEQDAAIASFAELTGEDPYALGCECCGSPHSFY